MGADHEVVFSVFRSGQPFEADMSGVESGADLAFVTHAGVCLGALGVELHSDAVRRVGLVPCADAIDHVGVSPLGQCEPRPKVPRPCRDLAVSGLLADAESRGAAQLCGLALPHMSHSRQSPSPHGGSTHHGVTHGTREPRPWEITTTPATDASRPGGAVNAKRSVKVQKRIAGPIQRCSGWYCPRRVVTAPLKSTHRGVSGPADDVVAASARLSCRVVTAR